MDNIEDRPETGNKGQNSVLQMPGTVNNFCQECTETNADSIQKPSTDETPSTLASTEHLGDEAHLPAIPDAVSSQSSKSDTALSTTVKKSTRGSSVTHLESATTENNKVTMKMTPSVSQSKEKSSNVKSSTDDAEQQPTSIEGGDNGSTRRYSKRERQPIERPDFVDFTDQRLSDIQKNVVMEECTKPPSRVRKKSAPPNRIDDDNMGERQKRLKGDESNAPKEDCQTSLSTASTVDSHTDATTMSTHIESKKYGIDSRVLDCLPPSAEEYHEESSYRYDNPPFPEKSTEQLAVNRDKSIPGNMTPVDSSKLTPLQKPPPLPQTPTSEHCVWTYDEISRILLANFKTPATNSGRVVITREDEEYLLKMMERDDITVISEGLADEFDLSLLGKTYVESRLGSQFHHKVKEFRKTSSIPCDIPTGETAGQYQEKGWHSMKFKDYFNYLSLKEKILSSDESVTTDDMFTFKDSNGKDTSVDTSQSVLVSCTAIHFTHYSQHMLILFYFCCEHSYVFF